MNQNLPLRIVTVIFYWSMVLLLSSISYLDAATVFSFLGNSTQGGTVSGTISFGSDRYNNPHGAACFETSTTSLVFPGSSIPVGNSARTMIATMKSTQKSEGTGHHGQNIIRYGTEQCYGAFGLRPWGCGLLSGVDLQEGLCAYGDVPCIGVDAPAGPRLNDGKWHQLGFSYDGVTGYLFVDGIQMASRGGWTLSTTSNTDIILGYKTWGSVFINFVGCLSDVFIFDTSLSATDIKNLYLPKLPVFPNAINPIASWNVTSYTWTCSVGYVGPSMTMSLNSTDNSWIVSGGPMNCKIPTPTSTTSSTGTATTSATRSATSSGSSSSTTSSSSVATATSSPMSSSSISSTASSTSIATESGTSSASSSSTASSSTTATPTGSPMSSSSISSTASSTSIATESGTSSASSSSTASSSTTATPTGSASSSCTTSASATNTARFTTTSTITGSATSLTSSPGQIGTTKVQKWVSFFIKFYGNKPDALMSDTNFVCVLRVAFSQISAVPMGSVRLLGIKTETGESYPVLAPQVEGACTARILFTEVIKPNPFRQLQSLTRLSAEISIDVLKTTLSSANSETFVRSAITTAFAMNSTLIDALFAPVTTAACIAQGISLNTCPNPPSIIVSLLNPNNSADIQSETTLNSSMIIGVIIGIVAGILFTVLLLLIRWYFKNRFLKQSKKSTESPALIIRHVASTTASPVHKMDPKPIRLSSPSSRKFEVRTVFPPVHK